MFRERGRQKWTSPSFNRKHLSQIVAANANQNANAKPSWAERRCRLIDRCLERIGSSIFRQKESFPDGAFQVFDFHVQRGNLSLLFRELQFRAANNLVDGICQSS